MLKVNAFNIQKTLIFHIGVEGENNMKKLAIAGASAVIAALPVVGVFAASDQASFTDHLTVIVNGGCTLETSATQSAGTYADRTLSKTIAAGTVGELTGTMDGQTPVEGATITVTCNGTDATKSWAVTVTPPASGLLTSSSSSIAPGAQVSGATSGWFRQLVKLCCCSYIRVIVPQR